MLHPLLLLISGLVVQQHHPTIRRCEARLEQVEITARCAHHPRLCADRFEMPLFDPLDDPVPFPFPASDEDSGRAFRYLFNRAVHARMLQTATEMDGLFGHCLQLGDGPQVGTLAHMLSDMSLWDIHLCEDEIGDLLGMP